MMPKLLTIVVPSYNMEKYLQKCLGSLVVAPELMERLEVLVVNDGSKDRTSEIAHEFAAKWPGTFKVIDKENGHYGSCVNAGLKETTGQYVKILDADDSFDTQGFENWFGALTGIVESYDAIFTDYVQVNERGEVTDKHVLPLLTGREFKAEFLERQGYIAMHAIAYRSELLREISYHQTEGVAYTDTEWACRPLSYAKSFRYFQITVYRYLLGREGQSADPTVVAKSAAQMARVARDLSIQFVEDRPKLSKEGAAFFARSVFRVCLMVYNVYLLKSTRKSCCRELPEFNDFIKQTLPDIYEELRKIRLPRKRGLPYIRLWDEHSALRTVIVLVCKAYLRLRAGRVR